MLVRIRSINAWKLVPIQISRERSLRTIFISAAIVNKKQIVPRTLNVHNLLNSVLHGSEGDDRTVHPVLIVRFPHSDFKWPAQCPSFQTLCCFVLVPIQLVLGEISVDEQIWAFLRAPRVQTSSKSRALRQVDFIIRFDYINEGASH